MSEHKKRYTVSPAKPTRLPYGPPPPPPPGPSINGEPLSTKQLHELITSQAMTIDRLLGDVNRYKQAFVEVGECLQKGNYIKAGWIIRELLK